MRYLALLLFLAASISAPPTPLRATWERPGVARLTWSGPGCLYRNQTLISCYPRDAGYLIELGATGPLDAAYHPHPGDVYRLVRRDGRVDRAELRGVEYLPVFR